MIRFSRIFITLLVLACANLGALPAMGQDQVVSSDQIISLNVKLTKAREATSSARKKLALRRVIREVEALLKKHASSPNRYEVLNILFRSQQVLVSLDDSAVNRKAFLATCAKLAAAPNEYAALRLDADLLLTQTNSARQGADSHARSDALRPLVERYRDTEVETKVIRISMIMALEFGNTKLVNDLRKIVAERFPDDMGLINFQREKLAGQVFGAPFIGTFQRGDGKMVRFPMDFLGTTTVIYCWSKENDGEKDLKALATAWKKAKVEHKAAGRFQFVSMNMDDLPDAGESILRGLGLDWQALKMPKGQDNPIYKTYVKRDTPTILTVSPTGYVALYQSAGGAKRTYERWLKSIQSMLSRGWAQARNSSQLQSVFAGEFLVIDAQTDFDPAAPPEYKAIASGNVAKQANLPRTAASVPEEKLRAIQACFIKPPLRYRTPHDEILANFKKADALCRAAIAEHPQAPDLWIVRNRRITALMGLWKARADATAFTDAVAEAKLALMGKYPAGTDVVARLCLARQALLAPDADPKAIIKDFIKAAGEEAASGPSLVAASLLALDTGDRLLHKQYRRVFLDKHANDPSMWTATAFLLDRYHRYWMYQPPYTAGWTFGRRQGYFLTIGTPEDAQRAFQAEFKTLDGEIVKIPESSEGKWTVISFVPTATGNGYLQRSSAFLAARPFDDVKLIAAVLDDDADTARKLLEEKKKDKRWKPAAFPTLLVPGGTQNPIARQLGIRGEDVIPDTRPKMNILILRPDGSIATVISGLTMSYGYGPVIQNVIEWQDEKNVDDALARGDLKEAKRLAFAHAPVKQVPPEDAPRHWKPKKIGVPHLRSRAKVYLAMARLEAAQADIQAVFLKVNSKAGHISMRTDELEETETLKATILTALEEAESK
jgi:hypothetical protein